MALRGISEADVAAALALPIRRQASYAGREEVYGATLDGRTIKVVIVPGTAPLLVVTAMRIHPRRVPKEEP
jgi:hypothetical protein